MNKKHIVTEALKESKSGEKITIEIPLDFLWLMISEIQFGALNSSRNKKHKRAKLLLYAFIKEYIEPRLTTNIRKHVELGWQAVGISFDSKEKRRQHNSNS